MTIESFEAQALIDPGSTVDLIASRFCYTNKLTVQPLAEAIHIRLALHGSRGKLQSAVEANILSEQIQCRHQFKVAALSSHDLLLGLPFLTEHGAVIDVTNRTVRFDQPAVESVAHIQQAPEYNEIIFEEFGDVFVDTIPKQLPPLRKINHRIPLVKDNVDLNPRAVRFPERYLEGH